jgi:ADP-dependent NAD(P)H-hydrate dehydratase / NAD(P)H-hydrate epimerase
MRDVQPLYFAQTIQTLEAAARAAFPTVELMERAGLAAAQRARELLGAAGTSVLVLAGPGNNGGDAFVVARHLRAWFYRVDVVFAGQAERLPADAHAALQALQEQESALQALQEQEPALQALQQQRLALHGPQEHGGELLQDIPAQQRYDLIIDGLFGTGLSRALDEGYIKLIAQAEQLGAPVLALDMPSGINANTGQVMGQALRAQHTITFIALKPGLLTLDGPDYRGELSLDTLGLDAPQLAPADGHAISSAHLRGVLPARLKNSHKGTFGSVGVIGGAKGMVGAALLAGRAALYTGAGRVYIGLIAPLRPPVDFGQPELMLRSAADVLKLDQSSCLALGPGMGTGEGAAEILRTALLAHHPLVIDADALNLLASDATLQRLMLARRAPSLLTPHPAEAARLLGTDTATIQASRVDSACRLAARLNAYVVLKGAGSVCALPDRRWFINATGNPGLASAGMGDVLTGFIAALLAQGASPEQALLAGVHLHGLAADMLIGRDVGPRGLTAGELIVELRQLVNIH